MIRLSMVRALAWVALSVCLGGALPAHGAEPVVIYDTYPLHDPQRNQGRIVGAPSVGSSTSFQWADPIVVPGGTFLLDALTVRLGISGTVPKGDVAVRFWNDGANQPASVIESWVVPSESLPFLIGVGEDFLLPSAQMPTLGEGERYWVSVAMVELGTAAIWKKASETLSDEWVFSESNGEAGVWMAAPSADPLGFLAVTAIPVSEPAAELMRLAAFAALAVAFRRGGRSAGPGGRLGRSARLPFPNPGRARESLSGDAGDGL